GETAHDDRRVRWNSYAARLDAVLEARRRDPRRRGFADEGGERGGKLEPDVAALTDMGGNRQLGTGLLKALEARDVGGRALADGSGRLALLAQDGDRLVVVYQDLGAGDDACVRVGCEHVAHERHAVRVDQGRREASDTGGCLTRIKERGALAGPGEVEDALDVELPEHALGVAGPVEGVVVGRR